MAEDLQTQFQKVIGIVSWECVEDHGFEAPYSIQFTDASGYVFSAAFVEHPEQGRPQLFGIKAPEDENGTFVEHTLVFPLRVVASDHEGRIHKANFQRIQ